MRIAQVKRQAGASIVHWLIALTTLMAFGALAVDLNNVYVSLAQMQIAADAGALEGTRRLYDADGNIDTTANLAAQDAVEENVVQGLVPDEIQIDRGHWQFMTSRVEPGTGIERGGIFTANPTDVENPLIDPATGNFKTWQELNTDPNEINAVQVIVARNLNPVQAFFGRLLGINGYQAQATSVAYVGFAGKVLPGELDLPIALCQHRLKDDLGDWSCSVGRMISSSDNDEETGGWTNFQQPDEPDQCGVSANANQVKDLVDNGCPPLNPELFFGMPMGMMGGQVNTAFADVRDCWRANSDTDDPPDGEPDMPWQVTLPVINCCDEEGENCGNPGPCNPLIGTVSLEILWIVESEAEVNQVDDTAPRRMAGWDAATDPDVTDVNDGVQRWNAFVEEFNIKSGPDATEYAEWVDPQDENVNNRNGYRQKTIYFSPDCDVAEPVGGTGGSNFGIRAAVPVLVY